MGQPLTVFRSCWLSRPLPRAGTADKPFLVRSKATQWEEILAHPAEAQAIGVGHLDMLSTYVTLAFPELVNRTKIVAGMTKAGAQGVAGGGEGCEGLMHFLS